MIGHPGKGTVWRTLVVSAAAFALMTACTNGSGGSSGGNRTTGGGILHIGSTDQIDSLNPFVAFNEDPYIVFTYEYPGLVQYDTRTSKFVGDFATSWSHSPDYKTWTFKTVPNAKWSDGTPLTAEDVVWNINTVVKFKNGPTANSGLAITHVTNAVAPDPNTVVVHYAEPDGNVLFQLFNLAILPPQVWAKYATGDGKALRQFPNEPTGGKPVVSGGPFMMTKFAKNDIALFERNPNWYGPKPVMDGFGIKYYATEDALVQALQSGEVDILETTPPTAVKDLQSRGFNVSITPGEQFRDFIINSNPKKTQHKELLDPIVRGAIAHAIDRNQIVKTAWLGYAQPGYSIVPPGSGKDPQTGKPWTDPSLHPETFDPALANKMLDDAGYARGPDGIRIANGQPMQYTVLFAHAELGPGQRAFAIIQQNLKAIGIGVTQKVLSDNATFNAVLAPGSKGYQQFDLAMWDWVASTDPDFILYVMTCQSWGVWNDSGYCNRQYEKLYGDQGATVVPANRLQIVYQMQDMIYQARPYIVLNYNDNIVSWSKSWTGFVPAPGGEINSESKQSLTQAHQV